jgi:predicted DCC family thiol-disulfide oxidoreductase YuxK/uncharacterized membrane protein YphA (DoxX/SURF4 family)
MQDAGPGAAEAEVAEPVGSRPLILFDGVCNLCNAAVSWVIERDRRNLFRFASLQSRAARSALAAISEAGALAAGLPPASQGHGAAPDPLVPPAKRLDSVVLIDGEGVHVRSDAAIRIARSLGFPWSLAGIGFLLPRRLRDGLYDWIARNRYRWFGRQNACLLPTPELRARFLDADEPPLPPTPPIMVEEAPSPPTPARERPSALAIGSALAHRVLLSYLFLALFPFPVGTLPYTRTIAMTYVEGGNAFVTWVAKAVFGIAIQFYPGGSGDTTFSYIEVATNLTLALVAAIVWTLVRRGSPVSERTSDAMRTYVRLALATILLSYGWDKVMPLQMPAPGPDRLLVSIGDTSPMGLLWTFMGASPAYQIFAGLGEVVAGLLLFWRRTAQLGSLVGVAVLTNVVVLNFCYDVPVKIFSSHLLLMALFLLAPHAARLVTVLVLNLPAQPVPLRPFPLRHAWMRRTILVLKVAFFVWVAIVPAYVSYQTLKTLGRLAPPTPLQGTYRVESFSRDGVLDRANEDAGRWVRVGLARNAGTIQRADGRAVRMLLQVDKAKRTLTFTPREAGALPVTLRYSEPGPGLVRIVGKFEGGETVVLLRRQTEERSLLMTRGFHWINEVPLNR